MAALDAIIAEWQEYHETGLTPEDVRVLDQRLENLAADRDNWKARAEAAESALAAYSINKSDNLGA